MVQYKAQFIDKMQLAKNAWFFRFVRPADLTFFPGQYLNWAIHGISRSFTLSLSPKDTDIIAFTTESGVSEYKKALFALQKGQKVSVQGPLGGFYFRDTDTKPQVFLAEGIGITPFYTMITHIATQKIHVPMILLVSFPTQEDSIFYDELKEISRN